jgi:hypothetical protein
VLTEPRERHFGRAPEACPSPSPRCRPRCASSSTSWCPARQPPAALRRPHAAGASAAAVGGAGAGQPRRPHRRGGAPAPGPDRDAASGGDPDCVEHRSLITGPQLARHPGVRVEVRPSPRSRCAPRRAGGRVNVVRDGWWRARPTLPTHSAVNVVRPHRGPPRATLPSRLGQHPATVLGARLAHPTVPSERPRPESAQSMPAVHRRHDPHERPSTPPPAAQPRAELSPTRATSRRGRRTTPRTPARRARPRRRGPCRARAGSSAGHWPTRR